MAKKSQPDWDVRRASLDEGNEGHAVCNLTINSNG